MHKKDAIYAGMLARINARGLGWSRETWEVQFGEISEQHVFGNRVWHGFKTFLHLNYMPSARGYVTGYALEDWVPVLYTAPLNFSRACAAMPKSDVNPGGRPYPAMIPRSDAELIRRQGRTVGVTVICIHILIFRTRPWSVHSDWITFVIV